MAFVAVGWTPSVGHFCLGSFPLPKRKQNYHLGTICFPSSLNLPIWSVWHPNPRRAGCLPYPQRRWWEESVRACFWKRSFRGESVCLLRPPWSSVPPLPLLSSVSTSVTCDMQKRINSDMGAESRKGGRVAWPTGGDEEALEWGNRGRLEIGARSSNRRKKGLLTLDHGSCFDLSVHKSGVAFGILLGSLGMSLLLLQRQYKPRKLIRRGDAQGYSHLPRHLALLTYPTPEKHHHKSCSHACWKGSLEAIQSQPPAQAMSSKIRLLRACAAEFGESPGKEVAQPLWAPLQCLTTFLPTKINK